MVRKFDLRLSRKQVKDLQRKDLEDRFMEVQEKIFKQTEEITNKDREITKKDQEIVKQSKEITKKDRELTKKEQEIAKQAKEITKKDQEIVKQSKEITKKNRELTKKEQEIAKQAKEITKKDQEIKKLQDKLKEIEVAHKTEQINREANQPSSKKPEWDKDGNLVSGKRKKKRKNGGRRKGSGNRKKDLIPTEENITPLDFCPECNEDLRDQPVFETRSRVVEDIPPPPKPVVSKEITQRKWCPVCRKVVSSISERALVSSDYGLNMMIRCAYLWVVPAVSYPNISKYLSNFFGMSPSNSGISKMMVRLSKILAPVYQEILMDVKSDVCLWADETGWRIRGKPHWLWAFANKHSAYYWIDKSRGSDVVHRLLGDIFAGVLITDAWPAYNKIITSARQTCMAHIFRKIRKFIDSFPQYRSLLKFYVKLRRILRDAQRLQTNRKSLGEVTFQRRFKLLQDRLSDILKWKNPNSILKEVIAKVKRQQDYILTFVKYEDVPSHNNYAEGIIKKGVLKRKVSGGSMSFKGAQAYCILQSIAQTCHLRGLSFFDFLQATLTTYIKTGKPMMLSQYKVESGQHKKSS